MRPVQIHNIFDSTIDTLTCVWGGLIAPRLCQKELEAALAPWEFLISFESSFSEDTHLSKATYFAIANSDERAKAVGIQACCMTALLAYESLKTLTNFNKVSRHETVVFFRRIRNASAHGNRFHFFTDVARKHFVDPGTVQWRSKQITGSLQDTPAFPDFFSAGDFPYLFEDISALLA